MKRPSQIAWRARAASRRNCLLLLSVGSLCMHPFAILAQNSTNHEAAAQSIKSEVDGPASTSVDTHTSTEVKQTDNPVPETASTSSSQNALAQKRAPTLSETPEQFVKRYLTASSKAKAMKELATFFEADSSGGAQQLDTLSAKDRAIAQAFANLGMVLRKSTMPVAGVVTKISAKGGKTFLSVKGTQAFPEAKLDLSRAGNYIIGTLTLVPMGDDWRICAEFWKSKNGTLEQALGTDPNAPINGASRYRDALTEAVEKVWKTPATGTGHVRIEYRNSISGGAQLLAIVDMNNCKESVDVVQKAFKHFVLPPLSPDLKNSPIVLIDLNWENGKGGIGISENPMPMLVPAKSAQQFTPNSGGDWLTAAATEPFKKAIAAGIVDGTRLTFKGSELKPMPDGTYTLELFQPLEGDEVMKVRVYLDSHAPFNGKTILLPQTKDAPPNVFGYPNNKITLSQVQVFRGNHNRSKGIPADHAGRISFLSTKSGAISGYICLHMKYKGLSPSEVNGYFNARINPNPREYSGAMFDKGE